ncbi:MXAN_6640 family putative metalloprotease [Nocardioides nanhaiensis]|uniref:Uncharacterized protein n=1 Tax=Nocardioides nanhaiensis TaxID=1476871 RepID=A0ABP8W7K4_9ACTN
MIRRRSAPRTLVRSTLALLAATALALAAGPLPATAAPLAAPAAVADGEGASGAARAALARVEQLLAPGFSAQSGRATSRDVTMALRDLALQRSALRGADRARAAAFLARPTDPPGSSNPDSPFSYGNVPSERACNSEVCVHWVESGPNAPSLADPNGNGRPDWIDTTYSTVAAVHDQYVAAGYRSPKPDAGRGGSNATDVYVADLGPGLYGYCTSDERIRNSGPRDAWAYCVVDNDYAGFPTNTPTENLQVTVAHEFFHAVQFGYDIAEDLWFLEGTAAWVEDEMYDGVDDNLQYLRASPLREPTVPLDTFDSATGYHYGTWIFFRYLSERFPAAQGGLPTIVRDMIRRTDSRRGAPDQYSMQAVKSVLAARKQQLPRLYATFASANRRPFATYDEARANRYPVAPLAKRYRLGAGTTRRGSFRADHMTSATVRATPAPGLRNAAWKLRIGLQMAPSARGSAAVASLTLRDGTVRKLAIPIGPRGGGRKVVPFTAGQVKHVELTMVNAGTQYRCFVRGPSSCQGVSRNDDVLERFTLQVVGRAGS